MTLSTGQPVHRKVAGFLEYLSIIHMTYYFFFDESGDHDLSKIDPGFPVFVLTGVLFRKDDYVQAGNEIIALKQSLWPDKKVILHSSDIRKCEKEFVILFDHEIKRKFYTTLNKIITEQNFTVIAAGVRKIKYNEKYGKIGEDVYQVSLSYIIERLVFYMDDIPGPKEVNIYIEKRGKREDALLAAHLQKIRDRGTFYVNSERLKALIKGFKFYDKKQDIIGLQVADLLAYPIARHITEPDRANPAFDLFTDKFYRKGGNNYGLKIYP